MDLKNKFLKLKMPNLKWTHPPEIEKISIMFVYKSKIASKDDVKYSIGFSLDEFVEFVK